MRMSISGSRGFVTELLKDIIYPEVCPICGDIITAAKRAAYHKAKAYHRVMAYHSSAANVGIHHAAAAHADAGASGARYRSHDTEPLDTKQPHQRQFVRNSSTATAAAATASDLRYEDLQYRLSAYYGGLVCDSCLSSLEFVTQPYCSKCGKPLADVSASATLLCSDCRTHARSFVQCRALLSYDERMRDIMADIKYNGKREYLKLFGLLAADRLSGWIAETKINCLIPVPIHASRLLKRGYNQSELLCAYISELTHIPVRRDIIIREKKTAAQKELNADERLLNLQNAFSPVKKLPRGTRALIVDDIYTTGSTMEACTECLRTAGAEAVYGLAVCIGEDKEAKNTTEGTHHGIQKRH